MTKQECPYEDVYVMEVFLKRDTDYPKFTSDRLYHIIKGICTNYAGNFYIRKVDGGQLCIDGVFSEVTEMRVIVSGISENEADMIAADICAFLQLPKVWVRKSTLGGYCISEEVRLPES